MTAQLSDTVDVATSADVAFSPLHVYVVVPIWINTAAHEGVTEQFA